MALYGLAGMAADEQEEDEDSDDPAGRAAEEQEHEDRENDRDDASDLESNFGNEENARVGRLASQITMVERPDPGFQTTTSLWGLKIKHIAQHANESHAILRRKAEVPPHLEIGRAHV